MDSQKAIGKSFSSKIQNSIDSHVCSLVIFKQDLLKACQPDLKITSNEYLKALNDLKILRSTPNSTKSYLIDDKYFKDPDDTIKMTFEKWLGQKSELIKAFKKAKKQEKQLKEYKKKQEADNKFQKLAQGKEIFKEWKKIKKIQHSSTEKLRIKQKSAQEKFLQIKKKVAKETYHEWLRHSLQSLKQRKSLEKQEKAKIEAEQKKNDFEKMTKGQQAQQAYKDWLDKKSKVSKQENKRLIIESKPKKVLMLAYSPNRKSSFSLTSSEVLNLKLFSNQITCKPSCENSKQEFIIKSARFSSQGRSEEYQVFDELSSIRKSPKIQSTCRLSEDPESFISEGNHELD